MATLITAYCPACDIVFWPSEAVCVSCGLVETDTVYLYKFPSQEVPKVRACWYRGAHAGIQPGGTPGSPGEWIATSPDVDIG